MRKILSFLIVAATIYFVACNVEEEPISQTRELPTKNPYAISIPQAIERLNAIFPDATKTTRATTADVATLTRGDFGLTTRAVNGALPTDPLIYIIPTDNNGCAIVGADKRMEAVYAVLDNSTLTAEDILGIGTRSDSQNEEDGVEIKEFVSAMLNDAITYGARIIIPDDSYYPDEPIDTTEYNDTTIVISRIYPLLKTKWHQKLPFSCRFPSQFDSITGCGPIAAAQILYYHKEPNFITSRYQPFRWDSIRRCEYGDVSHSDSIINKYSIEASRFVYEIASKMNLTPNEFGMGVLSNAFQQIAKLTNKYKNCINGEFEMQNVIGMLQSQRPIYTTGERLVKEQGNDTIFRFGHAWVIDGYDEREYHRFNKETEEFEFESLYYYVHCNYGWKGLCDGYYHENIFDLRKKLNSEYYIDSIGDKPHYNKGYNYRNIFIYAER